MKKMRQRSLRLETLEPRLQLAGLVTAALVDGDLIITGDTADNNFSVRPHMISGTAVPGAYEILGWGETSINVQGQESATIQGVQRDVIISDPGGAYWMRVGPPGYRAEVEEGHRLDVPRNLIITLKSNTKDADYECEIRHVDVGGDVIVRTIRGENSIRPFDTKIDGSFVMKTGTGDDTISFVLCEVGDDIRVSGAPRKGPVPKKVNQLDYLSISSTDIGGDVFFQGAAGASASAYVEDSEVLGKYTFEVGAGRDRINLQRSDVGELAVNTGAGPDRLTLEGTTVDKVFANLGAGPDLVELQDATVNTTATILTSSGRDFVGALGFTVDRFYLDTAQGPDVVFVGTDPSRVPRSPVFRQINDWALPQLRLGVVAGSVSISTGGGNDWLQVQDSRFTRNSQIYAGGGNDRIRIEASHYDGTLRLHTGAGSDVMDVTRCQIAGRCLVLAGGGNDKLRASGNKLSANLAVNMGSGRDVLGGKFNEVTGQVSFFGGSDFDTFVRKGNKFGGIRVSGFESIV